VKRALAALVGIAFVFGGIGLVGAQAPAAKTDDKKMDAKVDTKVEAKKQPAAVGTVKSASADSLVVAGKVKDKATEWTFALTDKTRIKKAGKSITAKDLAGGDKVTVRYTDHGGKMTASNVSVSAGAAKQAAKDDAKK
jgi:hypothetical protein